MFHGKKVTVAVGLSFALVTCCHVLFILYQDAKLLLPLPLFAAITAPIPAYYQHRGVASISPSTFRLWKGDAVPTSKKQPDKPPQIHIVVSHCRHDLDWLPSFTAGVSIAKITVISKCDADVPVETLRAATAADDSSTNVLRGLPNLGRCDFNFAYMLSNVTTKQKQEQPLMEHHHLADDIMDDDANDLILFLKDDMSGPKYLQFGRWRTLSQIIHVATSEGFACAMRPSWARIPAVSSWGLSLPLYDFSMYVDVAKQNKFKLFLTHVRYGREPGGYRDLELKSALEAPFLSEYTNLGEWRKALRLPMPNETVAPVCYGGAFAFSKAAARRHGNDVWERLLKSLSRGDNIEESHFAERTWAALLSKPLEEEQVSLLQSQATEATENWAYRGTLLRELGNLTFSWVHLVAPFVLLKCVLRFAQKTRTHTE